MLNAWIQTYTGKKFFPLAARPADVDIRDIAHALAMKCRFNGHCRVFYSVAEHSIRVSRALAACQAVTGCHGFVYSQDHAVDSPTTTSPSHPPVTPPTLAIWGLMHDAAEAYLADIGGPIKRAFHVHYGGLPEPFDMTETRLLAVIAAALQFPPVQYEHVREADFTLLATEARDLMSTPPEPWNLKQTPLPEKIIPLSPAAAESAFLARFAELTA